MPAQVGLLDFSESQLDSTCRELEQEYGEGKVLRLLCDVTDYDQLVPIIILVYSPAVAHCNPPPCHVYNSESQGVDIYRGGREGVMRGWYIRSTERI